MSPKEFRDLLCKKIATWDFVLGVAQTGSPDAPLVPGKSDVDLFVLCSQVPPKEERKTLYAELSELCESVTMEVCHDKIWGQGDIFIVGGIDIMPMYFCKDDFTSYVYDVLDGKYLYAEGRFYPIGRLASVETIHIFYEKNNIWTNLKEKVCTHPKKLFEKWYKAQSSLILDEEDLSRVLLRKEILFYHQVLENALDHFLQTLYALNNCYFPSRKRSEIAVETFLVKPKNCYKRLIKIIQDSSNIDSIENSVQELKTLTAELLSLKNDLF